MKIQLRQAIQKQAKKYKELSPSARMRLKGGVAILILIVVGVFATTQIFGNPKDVTGTVFHDYNGNGKRDNAQATNPSLAADRGLAGVTVKGFGSDNVLCDTQTTDANGAYTLHMGDCIGSKFRVEFSGLPTDYYPSQVGPDSKTDVQFVAPGTQANFGAYRSSDYCQNNPKLVTSCIRAGAYNGDEYDEKTVLGFLYNASGTTNPPLTLGMYNQVGTTYAQMYRPSNKSVYSGAYMRRHDGFGPGGPGAVYKSVVPASGTGTASSSLAFTIPNAGGDTHPTSDTNCNSRDGQSSQSSGDCWAHDQFSFDSPGKDSLGAMALNAKPSNPSQDSILVTNLNDRKVYKVTNLDSTPTPTGYAMPLSLPNSGAGALAAGTGANQHTGCATDDVRPFALTIHNGMGYAGFVCSAQSTRSAANLRAYIYSFNPDNMTFATVPTLEFPLNYDRSCAYGSSSNCAIRATWNPWISQFSDSLVKDAGTVSGSTTRQVGAPQPELADISFGDNGSMTIGFRDRYDDQMGWEAKSTNHNSSQRYTARPAGDILRACLTGTTYTLESAGTCNGTGPGNAPHSVVSGLPQGIGGAEFYNNEYFANTNGSVLSSDEVSRGALAQIPGYDSFANTSTYTLDGTSLGGDSGGIRTYNSTNATRTNAYRIYQNQVGDSFLKGNGLGDVDFICDSAPIEIGNRVWKDTNGNGVQDSTEPGIAGVTVTLKNSAGTVLATAVTDNDGNYLFSSRSQDENGQTMVSTSNAKYGVAALAANTGGFKLSLSTPADYTDPSRLQGLHLTTANTTANNGNNLNDSDAKPADPSAKLSAANPAVISFATGAPGANNHDLDFGFNQTVGLGNFVWLDSNKNGKVDGNEANTGINGVKVNVYAASADTNNDGSLSAAELSAATPLGSQVTANDTRPGSTNGRPGYYEFDGLSPGNYFVAIAASNFAVGGPLRSLTEVPVPAGVGDTQDDNNNHGSVPAGGSLASNGVVSTRINLQPGEEPTSASEKPDDDANIDTDTTIDFGFWHAYSLGNRVWKDTNNSATIDAGEPGIAGVKVNLLTSDGKSQVATTTTDSNGYYRFDNLSAGTYIVEIASSNFGSDGILKNTAVSSVGAGEEADPDLNGDNNDNGLNPLHQGDAVRSGTVTLGPGASEPIGESDLSSNGQGTDDAFANMTVDFGFLGSTSWGDTVYWDLDGDGTQDVGEPGIPNVTVTLTCGGADGKLATTGDNTTQSMKTDANGNYLFTNLLPNECKSVVTKTDVPGGTITTPDTFTHPIVDQTSFLDADYGFKGNGSIGNQVWKEVFNNGTYNQSEGDMPVSGVKIELYRDLNGNGQVDDSDILLGTRTTDDNGHYQFTNLPTDDNDNTNGSGFQYVVKVVDPDNKLKDLQASVGPNPGQDNNSQTPNGYGMTLTDSNPSNQTGDFGYHGLATVGDTVYYDDNNSGTQQPNEALLPNIPVTLTWPGPDGDCSTASDNVTKTMLTDANGNYLFTNLLGGKYCISIQPPAGTTITTNNQGQQFTLGPTQVDLTRDFGVIGDGTIGNQVFIDYNDNGKYDTGDVGIPGVTLNLYRDDNRNGKADAGEPVVKTATTDGNGQYNFKNLVTGDSSGVAYVVVVTDTANKLNGLVHVDGDGTAADNQSKDPTGYAIALTPTDNNHPEADFGYKSKPGEVIPPKFWKQQKVDGTSLIYTLTWINLSATNDIPTSFTDVIPDGTKYADGSLSCQAKGTSKTTACNYNATLNRIEWSGTVGADLGHGTPDVAVNPIVVTFRVNLNATTLEVWNQGFGTYGTTQVPNVPSDWIDTPTSDDPTYYVRTPTNAAIQKFSGGTLADTGQLIVAVLILAAAIIAFSISYVYWLRRTIHFK